MKVLIFSASTGGGHMSAANVMSDFLSEKGFESKVVDALEYISPILNKTIVEIYTYVASKRPKLWKLMYEQSNKRTLNNLILLTNSLISRKLLPLINDFKPDVIITTHPFTTEMISRLKSKCKINAPLVCVMTDYAPHRTWLSSNVDCYIVANNDMVPAMVNMGVNEDKIYPYGIPVDEDFFTCNDKSKTLKEIGFSDKIPTILVMAGSGGFADMEKIYRELQESDVDFQIIVITGKNKKMYDRMIEISGNSSEKSRRRFSKRFLFMRKLRNRNSIKNVKNTKVIYFTSEVDKYMKISDLIITKPGGLTVSEALACNLPMALFNAIPGQEEENANFLVSNSMAIKLDSKKNNVGKIDELLRNPEILNQMKFNCENFDKSNCLSNIHELLLKITNKRPKYQS